MRVTKSSIGGVLLAVAAITGCQSGSEGGVNIGSGQSADPVVLDFPVAYVRRAVPTGDEDLRELRTFQAGADLFLRDRASPAAIERNITGAVTNGEWDVRDVDVSFDGEKLVFAMRPPLIENADESEQPTWNPGTWRRRWRRPWTVPRSIPAGSTTTRRTSGPGPPWRPSNDTPAERARGVYLVEMRAWIAARRSANHGC